MLAPYRTIPITIVFVIIIINIIIINNNYNIISIY